MIIMHNGEQIAGGGLPVITCTWAKYCENKAANDARTDVVFRITDRIPGSIDAAHTVFDNTGTDLNSTNLQQAIVEVNAKTGGGGMVAQNVGFDSSETNIVDSDNVQDAIVDLDADLSAFEISTNQKLNNLDGLVVAFNNQGSDLDSTDVQNAVTEVNTKLNQTISDVDDAATAAGTSFNNSGSDMSSTDVQNAILELKNALPKFKVLYSGTKELTSQQSGTLTTAGDYITMNESIENYDFIYIVCNGTRSPQAARIFDVESIKARYGASVFEITEIAFATFSSTNIWASRMSFGFIDSTKMAAGWYGGYNGWPTLLQVSKVIGIKLYKQLMIPKVK